MENRLSITYLSINPIKKTVEQLLDGDFVCFDDLCDRVNGVYTFQFKIEQTDDNIPFRISRFVPETNDWGGSSRQSTMEQAKLRCILDAYVLHLQKSSDTTQWLKSLYNDEAKAAKLEPVL